MALAYNQISVNKRQSWVIVALFPITFGILGYLAIILYHWLSFQFMTPKQLAQIEELYYPQAPLYNMTNEMAVWVIPIVFGIAVIWMIISYFTGANMMIHNANATEISQNSNRQLYRLVENLCITRGLPVPRIFVINDSSLNAFATGRNPQNAMIAVTSGLLEKLDKAELQGVIAHELAHIENRDITILVLAIAGIAFFTFAGEVLLRISGRIMRARDGFKIAWIVFLAGMVCVIFGYVIAPILRFAMSRQREYLADASSALTTRNPGALANALEKIARDSRVEILDDHPSMASMCIAAPRRVEASLFNKLSGLYATHPPIKDRIKKLRQMDNMQN